MRKIKGLTERQQELCDYLYDMAQKYPDSYILRRQILLELSSYNYQGEDNLYNCYAATELTKDAQVIRLKCGNELSELLLSRGGKFGGYKFATRDYEILPWMIKNLKIMNGKINFFNMLRDKVKNNNQLGADLENNDEFKTFKILVETVY